MNTVLGKIAIGLLALFLVVYIGYQGVRYVYNPYTTETAVSYSVEDSLRVKGAMIREEEVITGGENGIVSYLVEDATRVTQGTDIAALYGSMDEINSLNRIEELEAEIQNLKDSQDEGVNVFSIADSVNRQISDKLIRLAGIAESGQLEQVDSAKSELLTMINKKQILTGDAENFSSRIEQLQTELDALQAGIGEHETVQSPGTGYFVSTVDGMEETLTPETVAQMSVSQLEKLAGQMTNTEDGALGKLVKGFTWQYAAVVPAEDLDKFWKKQTVELDFGITDFTQIPATVTEIRTDDSSENGIVFFKCNFASGQLLRLRSHTAQINFKKYAGLRISKKALRYQDGVEGVYILDREEVVFKTVKVEYEDVDFVICEWDRSNTDAIQLFDNVFIEGTDLYEGKQIK